MRQTAVLLVVALALLFAAVLVRHVRQPLHRSELERVALDYRIDVNTADAATLELLPGIGPGIARHVLDYREQGGRFDRPDDLQRVHYIGPRTAERLTPWVRFDGGDPLRSRAGDGPARGAGVDRETR